jgi:formylglycine-generating enzyme required for sulfatase activity
MKRLSHTVLVALLGALAVTACVNPAPSPRTAAGSNPQMVRIKGGSFEMGDVLNDTVAGVPDDTSEFPLHTVHLDSFEIARFEVTVREFKEFVDETGYVTCAERDLKAGHPWAGATWKTYAEKQIQDDPALEVSWIDAVQYCNWLSRKRGLPIAYAEGTWTMLDKAGQPTSNVRMVGGYRLPTEAEWEYAARERGLRVRFANGRDVALESEINFDARPEAEEEYTNRMRRHRARSASSGAYVTESTGSRWQSAMALGIGSPGSSRNGSLPVGSFPPNRLGLYDMSGNAWEWCFDAEATYPATAVTNPCSAEGPRRVLRGGGWVRCVWEARASHRNSFQPQQHCPASGFRLARTIL